MRALLLRACAVGFGLLVALLGLEVALRLLPASDSLRTQPVNAQSPILHFEPDRTVRLTRGWDARVGATKHVNNAGFLSDVDYDGSSPARKAVVIGDSYVEAQQVENARAIHGLLNAALAPRGAVYAVASSGSPLSQYLAYAGYAVQAFRPRVLVFVVVANDFDESLLEYKRAPGFHYFATTPGGYELVRIDYAPSPLVRVAQHFAVARYLLLNLSAGRTWTREPRPPAAQDAASADRGFVGNVPRQVSPQHLADAKRAVDLFFRELPRRAAGTPALFVVDAIRPDLYSSETLAAARGSYFDQMRSYFIDAGRRLGYEVLDLEPIFEAHHAEHGMRFEYAGDAHWNELAHELAAELVLQSATFRSALAREPSDVTAP